MSIESGREPFDPHERLKDRLKELYEKNERLMEEYNLARKQKEALANYKTPEDFRTAPQERTA